MKREKERDEMRCHKRPGYSNGEIVVAEAVDDLHMSTHEN